MSNVWHHLFTNPLKALSSVAFSSFASSAPVEHALGLYKSLLHHSARQPGANCWECYEEGWVYQQEANRRVVTGAGPKGQHTEVLLCAPEWCGGVSLALHPALLSELGCGINLPSGGCQTAQGLSYRPWLQAGICARLISHESLCGQDILEPTWAQSVLEFSLLVFKSFSCGEKCLPSAKTLRALEGKICVCEPQKHLLVFIP